MTATSSLNGNNMGLDVMALGASPSPTANGRNGAYGGTSSGSWFQALATAWGTTLDSEAQKLETMSNAMGTGNEDPSQIAQLTAESMKMSFLSQSENTSLDSAGDSLQTMARKE